MKATGKERDESIAQLREWIKPGDTVYTVLRSVSKSGMSRTLDVYLIEDSDPMRITWSVSKAAGFTYSDRAEAIRADGCGMDMGFHVVYNLSRVLFPDGFGCIGERCPSNDHSNGDRDYTPHASGDPVKVAGDLVFDLAGSTGPLMAPGTDGIHWHMDGGYALRHRWI